MSTSHSFLLPIFYRTVKGTAGLWAASLPAVKGTAGSVAATFPRRIKLLSIICQLHANAGSIGDEHTAVLITQRLLDHLILCTVQTETGKFLNAQIRNGSANLQTGRRRDRAKRIVRNH